MRGIACIIFACSVLHWNIKARELPQPEGILHADTPTPPVWPESYTITYTFSLPYTAEVQPDMIKYDVKLYRDAYNKDKKKVKMETLDGTNVMYGIAGDAEYQIVPMIDEQKCKIFPGGYGAASANALPAIETPGWEYAGEQDFNGQTARLWQYKRQDLAKTTVYTFYVSLDDQPLRLHMLGQELTAGSHFGEYICDYIELIPGRPDKSVFEPPSLCEDDRAFRAEPQSPFLGGTSAAALRMLRMTPTIHFGGEDSAYDAFLSSSHGSGRIHSSLSEYQMRKEIFLGNAKLIEEHNSSPAKTFTMAMNRFGDWTREEFRAVMLPNHGKNRTVERLQRKDKLQKHEYLYEPLSDRNKLPAAVDWRGTGADAGVKDQAVCGSCWTFGAVGAMESAWFHATGEAVKFSEQQVMDCSYGYEPHNSVATNGCDGGSAWAGIGHSVEAGGIALLSDYQYLGQNDYCREDSRPLKGKFKGFARIPMKDDLALMEAIYSRGPIAVSLDASQDSFTFYSSGVYYDTKCRYDYDDLDHAMVVVGYGTEEAGDYWLVKNSWSTLWGDKGYIKVSRDNHGCGASTDALYALVDEEAIA